MSIPPAFRRTRPRERFLGLDDAQLIEVAGAAFRAAQMLPVGTEARAEQWARFDQARIELGYRAIGNALAKLHQHELELGGSEQ